MNQKDFKKTKEELKEEIKKNDEQIAISDERTRMAQINQFEYQTLEILGLSVLPYFLGLFILFGVLSRNRNIETLTSTIPGEAFPFIIAGSSLAAGTIWEKILQWKSKTKERLKSFTTARTQSEKLEEEVKYAIELEKAQNRNKAIKQIIDSLCANQAILNSLSNRYDLSDNKKPQTREESQKRVAKLSILLNEKNDELDVLSIKKVLHEKFWKIRTKGEKIIDIFIKSMIGGMFTMMYSAMTLLMLRDSLAYTSISSSLISILTPFIAGTVVISGYMVKRNQDYKKAFDNLNDELGKNSLPCKIKESYEEQQDINNKIENKMREISIIGIELQEQKRYLESFADGEKEEEQILKTSGTKPHIIKQQKDTCDEISCTQDASSTFMCQDAFVNTEEKGTSLVLKRKPYNPKDNK